MTQKLDRIVPIALTALVLLLFWDNVLLWPLKILVVFFHELSHAAAALLTGGTVLSIGLDPRQGGVTHTAGGIPFLVLNAGYLGSLAFGIALLASARTPKRARVATASLAVVLTVATLIWLRPLFSFGFLFAAIASGAMFLLARKGSEAVQQTVLRTIGTFSALYALWDIRSDVLSPGRGPVGRGDARRGDLDPRAGVGSGLAGHRDRRAVVHPEVVVARPTGAPARALRPGSGTAPHRRDPGRGETRPARGRSR